MSESPSADAILALYARQEAPLLVLSIDRQGIVLAANPFAGAFLGANPVGGSISTLLGETPDFDPRGPAARPEIEHRHHVVTAAGDPQTFVFRFHDLGSSILVVGRPDVLETEWLKREMGALNNELATMTRKLHAQNAEAARLNEKMTALLRQKEALLHEVNHRAKNNFAIISGLLDMQVRHVLDPSARRALEDSRDRVGTMAMIHERLYRAPDPTGIDMRGFLTDLVGLLVESLHFSSAALDLQYRLEDVLLPLDQAIPCALIVNELITNAFKYGPAASGKKRPLRVEVELAADPDGNIRLRIANSGRLLPEDFDIARAESMGLSLVRLLAQAQLGGTIETRSTPMTEFVIRFPKKS